MEQGYHYCFIFTEKQRAISTNDIQFQKKSSSKEDSPSFLAVGKHIAAIVLTASMCIYSIHPSPVEYANSDYLFMFQDKGICLNKDEER